MEMQWYRIYTAVLCVRIIHIMMPPHGAYTYVRTRSKQMYIQFNYIR